MKKITKGMLVVATALLSLNVGAVNLSGRLLITANLTGSQETPAVSTTATGVASFMLNPTRDTMCVSMAFNGLSGAITAAHVHVGAPGVSGGVVTDLSSYIAGNSINAVLTGSNLTSAMVANYLAGNYYVNVHTAANPNGEIRGQLYLESDYNYTSKISGAQETPSVTTNAYGFGSYHLSQDMTLLTVNVIANGLSGVITAAHLHYGAIGVSGGVAVDLSSDVFGNIIRATVKTTPALLDSLMAGHIYVNIHTAANPNGEVRGQLVTNNRMAFDAIMTGSQETPSVTTSAVSIANMQLNSTMDTLWLNAIATGLSGKITGAHLHSGAIGVSGGVVFDFSSDTSGMAVSGFVAGSANITTAIVNSMLEGLTYLNIHTAANPNGEIRGQVYRYAREGYTIMADGAQETPSVSTSAYGVGIASIDEPAETSVHYMITVNGLSGGLTSAHFHQGTEGNAGGVLFTIPTFMPVASANSTAVGFWTDSTATTPFTITDAGYFASTDIYLNAHTAANPNGEIRGQIIDGSQCSTTTGIAENVAPVTSVAIYPNPSNGLFNVLIYANQEYKNGFAKVYNVLGQKVFSQEINIVKGQNSFALDLSNLKTGIYMITIQEGNNEITKRIVKN